MNLFLPLQMLRIPSPTLKLLGTGNSGKDEHFKHLKVEKERTVSKVKANTGHVVKTNRPTNQTVGHLRQQVNHAILILY